MQLLWYPRDMDRSNIETNVAAHYSQNDVTQRILTALDLQDAPPGSVPLETLFPVDQLHHGGVKLTEKMATMAKVRPGLSVLDAGSGIGGSARFLTERCQCKVDALDLSATYVQTAEALDNLVGLGGQIAHRVGSVLDLPYEDQSFDVVWSQNVTMNVADKALMFAEALRVLRPGGVYVLTHIGQGNNAALDFPVPWAMTEATSFTTPPPDILHALDKAGFQTITDHSHGAPPPPPPPQTDGPDDSPAMGDDMPLRRANTMRAVADGRLVPMLVTAYRP